MVVFVVIVFLISTGIRGADADFPQNTVSTAGSNVTIKCSSHQRGCNGVEWIKPEGRAPAVIFKNTIFNDFKQKYSVDNSSGCNLVITDVQLEDAGRFTCTYVMNQQTQERTATLIVLRSQPTCRVNVSEDNTAAEGDGVSLVCEATYNGTDNASVTWEDVKDATPEVIHGKSINHTYSFVARAPSIPAYKCAISFNVVVVGGESATNAPVTSCATPVRTVLYSARNVNVNPSFTTHSSGLQNRCSADGNPSPTYKWQQRTEDKSMNNTWIYIHDGPEFVPSKNSSRPHRCVARNAVKGVNYYAISDTFWILDTVSDRPNGYQPTYSVGIAIGMISGILITVFLNPFA